jgi:hypothetical protein
MTEDEIFTEVAKAEHEYWGDSRNRFLQMIEEKHERDDLSALKYNELPPPEHIVPALCN